ncbi:hypothetical protein COR52_07430 [Vibrio mediterranei]|uniref:Uncharacterized protein n=1 Tax=Vibrio mediterranei TaxID=689 RepID=A0ABX5DKG6_9VIBR|nr:hypothetical protein COR52_07430 [Vibrio mediterranei]PRQ69106.1 hypothetical protein COR51_00500 [Vibrio mediterranei]
MCKHGNLLQRQKRTLWQKLRGIKEIYVCSRCGHIVTVK